MGDLLPCPGRASLARVANDLAELLVDAEEPAVEVLVGDADGRVLERPAEPLLALAQGLDLVPLEPATGMSCLGFTDERGRVDAVVASRDEIPTPPD